MRFGLLGSLTVIADSGSEIPIAAARQRILLAALLLGASQPLPGDALADAVWDEPPRGYLTTLRSYVMRLRQTLGPEVGSRLVTRSPGYLFRASEDELDVSRFEALCRTGRSQLRTGDWAAASAASTEALALWRAAPLTDVASQSLRSAWAPRLDELRLQARENRVEAELALGHHQAMLPELRDLTAHYPLRENLHAALVETLAATGQRALALEAYRQARRVLVDELGIEPGAELRGAQQRILAGENGPARPEHKPGPHLVRQLPPPIRQFVGRTRELEVLSSLLDAGTVVISAIGGTAGIGKSALAVHWAHQVADRFPDGQLYVNLRGFEPTGTPMSAAEAVRVILDGWGVPPAGVPVTLDAQVALYRSLLADRRVLVVLDNARDAEQVRPLLPAGPGCLAVVTSRTQLASLVVTDAAHLIELDLLDEDDARRLLAERLGPDRVAADPPATDAIIERCAGLPIALGIAAARAASAPRTPLAALAGELDLAALSAGDEVSDVRAVFSWSYRTLPPDAARLFRLLGLHPGPDLTAPAAASLAGMPLASARQALRELARAHLIAEHRPGRFASHDLLRAYAADLAGRDDEAITRLLDHYLRTAYAAARPAQLIRDPLPLPDLRPGVVPEEPAPSWFADERFVLLGAVELAAATGHDRHAWQLAWTLSAYLDRRGYWSEQIAVGRTASAAARRAADETGAAYAHRLLARAYSRTGALEPAYRELRAALEIYRRGGDKIGQAQIHRNLGQVSEQAGRFADGVTHVREALDLYRAAGHREGQSHALNALGFCYVGLGDHERAVAVCRAALRLHEELGDREGQAATWDSLGYAYHHLGRHSEAIGCFRRTIELQRELGGRRNLAETLDHLGDTLHADGQHAAARKTWRSALAILDELSQSAAARVRSKLG